jgi:hypothetical protein
VTIDERFERIEHFTAGEAEQRRKDREEDRALWRETQRQIDLLTLRMAESNISMERMARNFDTRMDRIAEEAREADKKLGDRIDALVSAMGEFLQRMGK